MIYKIAQQLATMYLDDEDVDLEAELAKVASEHNLNAQSIERVANRTNRNIIVGLQKEAVKGGHDPHFTFPTVKTANVLGSLKTKKPSAVPTLPDKPKPSLGASIPDVDTGRPSRLDETDLTEFVEKEALDSGLALDVLQMEKLKLAEKKSQVARIEIALDDMKRRFEKSAAHQLLSGTPIEVLQSLPTGNLVQGVQDKIEEWGHKVAHLDREFELDEDHPVVEMSFHISDLLDQLEKAELEYKEAELRVGSARRKVRESYK